MSRERTFDRKRNRIIWQHRVFLSFVNHTLSIKPPLMSLLDLSNGIHFFKIIKNLKEKRGSTFETYNRMSEKGSRFAQMMNANTILKYLREEGLDLKGVKSMAIVDKDTKIIIKLLFQIIRKFHINPVTNPNDMCILTEPFEDIVSWMNSLFRKHGKKAIVPDVSFFKDGTAFHSLLSCIATEYELTKTTKNLRKIMEKKKNDGSKFKNSDLINYMLGLVQKRMDVPKIVKSIDFSHGDKSILATYFAYFRNFTLKKEMIKKFNENNVTLKIQNKKNNAEVEKEGNEMSMSLKEREVLEKRKREREKAKQEEIERAKRIEMRKKKLAELKKKLSISSENDLKITELNVNNKNLEEEEKQKKKKEIEEEKRKLKEEKKKAMEMEKKQKENEKMKLMYILQKQRKEEQKKVDKMYAELEDNLKQLEEHKYIGLLSNVIYIFSSTKEEIQYIKLNDSKKDKVKEEEIKKIKYSEVTMLNKVTKGKMIEFKFEINWKNEITFSIYKTGLTFSDIIIKRIRKIGKKNKDQQEKKENLEVNSDQKFFGYVEKKKFPFFFKEKYLQVGYFERIPYSIIVGIEKEKRKKKGVIVYEIDLEDFSQRKWKFKEKAEQFEVILMKMLASSGDDDEDEGEDSDEGEGEGESDESEDYDDESD